MIQQTFPITENVLSNGLKASQQLLDLLNAESENLAHSTDPHALTAIADSKKAVVSELELFTQQLTQLLATEQLTVNHQGITRYLGKAQAAGLNINHSHSCWINITAISQKCRTLNEQNGACIALLSRHTQRALQILRGKPQTGNTYGADGATRSELFSRTLISV